MDVEAAADARTHARANDRFSTMWPAIYICEGRKFSICVERLSDESSAEAHVELSRYFVC